MSPGSSVWIEVTHSMQRGILCAMSSVLKFCFSSPLTHSLIGSFCGSAISSLVTRYGPIGANVSRDFMAKKLVRRQAARRAVDEVDVAEDVVHRVGGLHVAGALADDQRHFGLALEDRRRARRAAPSCRPGPMIAVGALWKALIGAGSLRVPSSM